MTRIHVALIAALVLFLARGWYTASFWDRHDRGALIEREVAALGWPADELVVTGGGYETTGLLGMRTHATWTDGEDARTYELVLHRRGPFGDWTRERAIVTGPR